MNKMNNRIYVHYGHDAFDKKMLSESHATNINKLYKPHGLWASPVETNWGWIDFCKSEDFRTDKLNTKFYFILLPEAKVLHIYSLEDCEKCAICDDPIVGYKFDHKKVYSQYNAIELHITNDYERLHFNDIFYSWDVDSICVWNPDVIIPVANFDETQQLQAS